MTLHGGNAIVPLLLMGYNLVTQMFPSLILGLGERPFATRQGAIAGILTGVVLVALQTRSGLTLAKVFPAWPPAVTDLNVGVVALLANIAVMFAVSASTRRREPVLPR